MARFLLIHSGMMPGAETRREVAHVVLIADGDAEAARTLAGDLAERGWPACWTTRGAEALCLATTRPVALAVVDTRLVDMSGAELIGRLRSQDRALAVVVTAGETDTDAEIEARRAGIVYYSSKPPDVRQLADIAARRLEATRGRLACRSRQAS